MTGNNTPSFTEVLQREHAEKEKLRLQEMDEEEYDALPEEEKESIDLRHLVALRERKRRYWMKNTYANIRYSNVSDLESGLNRLECE